MTDSRLKSQWLGNPQFEDLSHIAWRVFTCCLMWCNEQATDGAIPRRYADRLLVAGAQPDAYAELIAAGLWRASDDGFQVVDWSGAMGQSTAEYVAGRREANRLKQAAYRERQAVKSTSEPDYVTGDVTGYVGQAQDRTSTEQSNENREPSPFCDKHPGGTSEPCTGCMNARQANAYWLRNRPTPGTGRRPRPGDGHKCVDKLGYGYCGLCEERVPDPNAWMQRGGMTRPSAEPSAVTTGDAHVVA